MAAMLLATTDQYGAVSQNGFKMTAAASITTTAATTPQA
jgi:hypothetical protein